MSGLLKDNPWWEIEVALVLIFILLIVVTYFGPGNSNTSRVTIKRIFLILLACLLVNTCLATIGAKIPSSSSTASALKQGNPPTVPSPTDATVSPTVSSPPSFTPPSSWKHKLNDPLTASNHDENWADDGPEGGCKFSKQGYDVTSTGPNYCNYNASPNDFSDLAYSIDMTIYKGTMAGIIVRLAGGNYYGFYITTSGTYEVVAHAKAGGGNDTYLVNFEPSSAIKQKTGAKNTLSVLAQGSSLQFWINRQKMQNMQDSTYSKGTIGVIVGNPKDSKSIEETVFSNANLWIP